MQSLKYGSFCYNDLWTKVKSYLLSSTHPIHCDNIKSIIARSMPAPKVGKLNALAAPGL